METRSKFEEERTAKNEEVELLLADLDRANLNAQAAAKEAEELRNSFESQPKVQPYSLKKKFVSHFKPEKTCSEYNFINIYNIFI